MHLRENWIITGDDGTKFEILGRERNRFVDKIVHVENVQHYIQLNQ